MLSVTVLCLRTLCETVEDIPDELYVGRGAFDVELAPRNKLIIIIIIIIKITVKYTSVSADPLATVALTYLFIHTAVSLRS